MGTPLGSARKAQLLPLRLIVIRKEAYSVMYAIGGNSLKVIRRCGAGRSGRQFPVPSRSLAVKPACVNGMGKERRRRLPSMKPRPRRQAWLVYTSIVDKTGMPIWKCPCNLRAQIRHIQHRSRSPLQKPKRSGAPQRTARSRLPPL